MNSLLTPFHRQFFYRLHRSPLTCTSTPIDRKCVYCGYHKMNHASIPSKHVIVFTSPSIKLVRKSINSFKLIWFQQQCSSYQIMINEPAKKKRQEVFLFRCWANQADSLEVFLFRCWANQADSLIKDASLWKGAK